MAEQYGYLDDGEYGTSYYNPRPQYEGGTDWGSGLTGALSGGVAGAQIGGLLGGPAGALLGGGVGALASGLWSLFTGTQEQERNKELEAAQLEAQKKARKRMEQGFASELSGLETQRQIAEQINPAETIYGGQGRQGLLQIQQAQLAQQMAAQGARNRASLASRGLLGSGMEAATSGALAGQQAGAQAQLQANALAQYQQQQREREQQLAQLGMQRAQVTRQRDAARSGADLAAITGQGQRAQQIAARNQALLQSGLQSVQSGLTGYQQYRGEQRSRDNLNTFREMAGLSALPEERGIFQDAAETVLPFMRRTQGVPAPQPAPQPAAAPVQPPPPAAPAQTSMRMPRNRLTDPGLPVFA